MRLIRLLIVLVFIAGCALGGYTKYKTMQTIENSQPVISILEDTLAVKCDAGREELLAGVTASDQEDGDITDQIIIENASNFIEPGRCRIYYAVFDSAGKAATANRTLIYEDYTSPVLSVNEPLEFAQGSSVEILNKLSAYDCIDGDVTANIEILSTTVKNTVAGTYRAKVQISNSHGDSTKIELPVLIYDPKDMNLQLTLDTPLLHLNAGDSFSAKSHLKGVKDAAGNSVTLYWDKTEEHNANVNVSGSVVTETPGVYYVTYTVMNSNGSRGTAVLTVSVEGKEVSEND